MFQDFFSHLYAQQTSPIETLIFTLLSVLVFMALALILYVLVVLLLWKLRFTKVTRVRNLFFPSGEQLREYLGEYGLAVSTALVLATTLQLKHRIVDDILAVQVSDLALSLRELLPLRVLPADLETQVLNLTVEGFTRPLLSTGHTAHGELWRVATARALDEVGLGAFFVSESTLIVVSIVLCIAYLTWLAVRQLRKAQKPGAEFGGYGSALRRVALLATCMALLLASPALVSEQSLADSAYRRAAISAQEDPVAEPGTEAGRPESVQVRLEQEIVRQDNLFRYLEAFDSANDEAPEDIVGAIADLGRSLAEFEAEIRPQVAGLGARAEGLGGRLDAVEERARVLETGLMGLRDRVAIAEQGLSAAADRAGQVANALDDFVNDVDGELQTLTAADQRLRSEDVRIEEVHSRDLEALVARLQSLASLALVERLETDLEGTQANLAATERRLALLQEQISSGSTTGYLVVLNEAGCSFALSGNGVRTPNSVRSATWPLRSGTYTLSVGANCSVDTGTAGYEVASRSNRSESDPAFVRIGQRGQSFRSSVTIGGGEVRVVRVENALVVQ